MFSSLNLDRGTIGEPTLAIRGLIAFSCCRLFEAASAVFGASCDLGHADDGFARATRDRATLAKYIFNRFSKVSVTDKRDSWRVDSSLVFVAEVHPGRDCCCFCRWLSSLFVFKTFRLLLPVSHFLLMEPFSSLLIECKLIQQLLTLAASLETFARSYPAEKKRSPSEAEAEDRSGAAPTASPATIIGEVARMLVKFASSLAVSLQRGSESKDDVMTWLDSPIFAAGQSIVIGASPAAAVESKDSLLVSAPQQPQQQPQQQLPPRLALLFEYIGIRPLPSAASSAENPHAKRPQSESRTLELVPR